MSYLAPTPTRPIPSRRFYHPYTPDTMSTSPMSRCSDSFISTPDYDQDRSMSSWGMQTTSSSQEPLQPPSWSAMGMHYRLPYTSSENLLRALDATSSNYHDDYYSSNHQQQQQQQQQPEHYMSSSSSTYPPSFYSSHQSHGHDYSAENSDKCFIKHDSQGGMTPVSHFVPGTPNSGQSPQHSPSTSPNSSPVHCVPTMQSATSKRSRARKTPALSHSVVERRYREGLNSKIDLLHRVLEFADQHSAVIASSGSSSTSDEIAISFDETLSTKGAPKARKADILTNAIDYVKRSEKEKAALMHEIEFWKTRVASAADYS